MLKQSIFSKMSHMASEYGAINLSQGFPDFPIDPLLQDLIKEAADKNVHQYCPSNGHTGLLLDISELIFTSYERNINIDDEVIVTAGATQAIYTAIQALVEKGDEVLVLDPSYDCYITPIVLSGGIPVRIPLNDECLPDWDTIKAATSARTKLIITNNPHNPSGRVWRESDINELKSLLYNYPKLYVLSDEVYEYICFENKHLSIHRYEYLRKRSVVVSSFGKTFHITGWKVGYMIAEKQLMDKIKNIHQYMVFSVNSVSQHVIHAYLKLAKIEELSAYYKQKRDLFRNGMKQSRFRLLPCEGTYFQLADYSEISKKKDVAFTEVLTKEFNVAAIPVSVFSQNNNQMNMVRFCFAKTDETIENATKLLCKI